MACAQCGAAIDAEARFVANMGQLMLVPRTRPWCAAISMPASGGAGARL